MPGFIFFSIITFSIFGWWLEGAYELQTFSPVSFSDTWHGIGTPCKVIIDVASFFNERFPLGKKDLTKLTKLAHHQCPMTNMVVWRPVMLLQFSAETTYPEKFCFAEKLGKMVQNSPNMFS